MEIDAAPHHTKRPLMISFIVPAHNEEAWILRCLAAIRCAMGPLDEPYEIVVADDASTDSTALLAEQHGARVVRVDRSTDSLLP